MDNQTIKKPNRLLDEKSPYLLQHAYNPVDWFPWGREAFDKAKDENKPVFLSIGYSTCHWCHVMEAESFEDKEVAEMLNRDFISIKVDREERPDIDAVYMAVCQSLTGQGGWPTTIFMTPDQLPFFAGTYFPKKAIDGRAGLVDILKTVIESWNKDREKLIETGNRIVSILKGEVKENTDIEETAGKESGKTELTNSIIIKARRLLEESFDERNGGFGRIPKFPTPHNLLFLMKFYEYENNELSIEMIDKTLLQMYRGGIYDHIGGGFCRYSTDRQWLVPHFEKMLYDNALLSLSYTEAYRLTGYDLYMDIAKETLDYVLREMTSEEGGFYSAQDADSEGVEGKYYLFTPGEVEEILGEDEALLFCDNYDITDRGNFEGFSIPNLLRNGNYEQSGGNFSGHRKQLYRYRLNRTELYKDDKILTAWNGMMIAAFAYAHSIFRERKYLDAAVNADRFISERLTRKDRTLRVRYRDNDAAGNGYLDDYAYYIWGLIEIYEATYRTIYLQNALDYNSKMIEEFWDEENGGFYLTSKNAEKLIIRPKETYDGAIPSGNSVAAYNLVRLAKKMDSKDLDSMAKKQLQFLLREIEPYPAGHSFALLALYEYLRDKK